MLRIVVTARHDYLCEIILLCVNWFQQVLVCQQIHSSVAKNSTRFLQELSRHNYVTPTSYLELIGIFSRLIGLKKNELTTAKNRTKTGLDKVVIDF